MSKSASLRSMGSTLGLNFRLLPAERGRLDRYERQLYRKAFGESNQNFQSDLTMSTEIERLPPQPSIDSRDRMGKGRYEFGYGLFYRRTRSQGHSFRTRNDFVLANSSQGENAHSDRS